MQIISFVDELTLIAEGCGEIQSGKVKKNELNGIKTKYENKRQRRETKNRWTQMSFTLLKKSLPSTSMSESDSAACSASNPDS